LLGEEIQEFVKKALVRIFNVLHDRLLVVNFRSLEKDESLGGVSLFNFVLLLLMVIIHKYISPDLVLFSKY
jgi:hypothetical protein